MPVYATTQKRGSLGDTCFELRGEENRGGEGKKGEEVKGEGNGYAYETFDKTAFSMWIPEMKEALEKRGEAGGENHTIAIVGIEAHICVTQTTLDLLAQGHRVYVLADGVSSCNKEEVPIALRRLAREGAVVTTSEGFLYECLGDAGVGEFRGIAALVKEMKGDTTETLQTLCKM
ncbi:hypothetical protein MMC09_002669 [Bachmanniomyces sp. S44760]|nr:hypothetical protein [Bachmanniomyces sp. S44760]